MEEFVISLGLEEEELRKIIEPLLDSEGFELVRLSLKRSQAKSLLALYVDTKDKKNGIILDNLEFISRYLSDVLDAQEQADALLKSRYDLEVSSPGVDRPLTKLRHFKDVMSERIKVRLKSPDKDGTKNLLGTLMDVTEQGISLAVEGKNEPIFLPFSALSQAHLVFDFTTISKPKKKLN